jgi:uncharacterized protein (DUF4213/DUF364 family)
MLNPQKIYELLLDYGNSQTVVKEILIGLTWTLCQGEGIGLAMSPAIPTRTLSWSGTLVHKKIAELAPWLTSWQPYEATVAMAAINAVINPRSPLLEKAEVLPTKGDQNLAVFEYFLPLIQGQKVSVIGRYPGLSQYEKEFDLKVIERQVIAEDFPDPAAEFLLPQSDWVFLTATSIVNKTFPRLVELSQNAKLVLMGPTVPWLNELGEMGIDYLAGVAITNPEKLRQTIAEGGGKRIFETGVEYRLLKLFF